MKTNYKLVNNLIVVDVAVNGQRVPMILDTGASATVLSKDTVDDLELGGTDMVCDGLGAGGAVALSGVEIPSLTLGSVTRRGVSAMTMDLSGVCEQIGFQVGGILGHDFFSDTRLTIDFPENYLLIEDAA